MITLLDDAPGIHDEKPVHRGDRREAVGDRDDGLAVHQRGEVLLDDRLHLRVERAGGLVEHEDRSILEEHPRDGDALALPARELDPTLADMRLESAPTGRVLQLRDELVRPRPAGGGQHLLLARAAPPVGDVVEHRAVQQRGVLGDHPDVAAQRLLAHAPDIGAIDEHASRLDVVEAQQEVRQRGLARPRATDQTDLLPALDHEREILDHAGVAPVVKAHVLEGDAPLRHGQVDRVGRIDHRARRRQHRLAVVDDADALEQPRELPHDPVGHALEPEHEAHARRHRPDRRRAVHPQRDAGGTDREQQQRVQQIERDVHPRHQPHLRVDGAEEAFHAVLRVACLVAGVGEQLDGGHVGVAVDDASGHLRTRVRLAPRYRLQLRQEVAEHAGVAGEPDDEGQHQPAAGRAHQQRRPDEVDPDVDEHVEHLQHRVADGERGLHDLGGHAPGELVLVERVALPEHPAMRPPAHRHGEVRHHRLVEDHRLQEARERQQHEDHQSHQGEPPALLAEEGLGIAAAEPVDEVAEEGEQADLEHGDQRGQARHRHQPRRRPPGVVPEEGDEPLGRTPRRGVGERRDASLEEAQHERVLGLRRRRVGSASGGRPTRRR